MTETILQTGQVYRYPRPAAPNIPLIDDLPNFYSITALPGYPLVQLERGINTPARVAAPDGLRRPVVLIGSSPHKVGSEMTPWQDYFDTAVGHIRYYGDNKSPGVEPTATPGNKALLRLLRAHAALEPEQRFGAAPLAFFRRVKKGSVRFEGFGIVERAEIIIQYGRSRDMTFSNYVFDFLVMSLAAENELFDWRWINARRDPKQSIGQTLDLAPESWKTWIRYGAEAAERVRRRVSKIMVSGPDEQRPGPGTPEEGVLREIYDYYGGSGRKRQRFEALAARIAGRIIAGRDNRYQTGWVTPEGGDWGVDFVGRLDIGSGFGAAKLVIIGQAKCQKLDSPTSGRDVARTVARLTRGRVGVYVTTSYFSQQVQRELIEDKCPIVLVHGLRLAQEVRRAMVHRGLASVRDYLNEVDADYESLVTARRPEEILLD